MRIVARPMISPHSTRACTTSTCLFGPPEEQEEACPAGIRMKCFIPLMIQPPFVSTATERIRAQTTTFVSEGHGANAEHVRFLDDLRGIAFCWLLFGVEHRTRRNHFILNKVPRSPEWRACVR
jgi:hypothetical protein